MTVRVVYDITVLGTALVNPLARTGVFRAVENIAYELAVSPECDLALYGSASGDSIANCLRYVSQGQRLSQVPFLFSRLERLRISLRQYRSIDLPRFRCLARSSDIRTAWHQLALDKRLLRRISFRGEKAIEQCTRLIAPAYLRLADVFHSPFHAFPDQISDARRLARFLTIYDMVPLLYPRFCSLYQIRYMEEILQSLFPDTWVICISQSTKDDLCNAIGLDPHRVFVTHLAASPRHFYPCTDSEAIASVRSKYGIPDGPYILGLNTLEPRKNVQHLILAFAKLTQEQGIGDLSLVLVGARGWLDSDIQELVSKMALRVRNRVILTGYVVDEDLAALYSGALVFVYPSFYEGFGLPPLEAMQCGTPVITSNTSSLPEVVGDAGIMLDPADLDGLCHSLYSVCSQPQLRAKLSRQSIARAEQFSWLRCAQQTIEAYEEAL